MLVPCCLHLLSCLPYHIVVVVTLLLLQNVSVDTYPLFLPLLRSAAAAVILAATVISLFLLLRLLILLVNEE